MEDTLLKKDNLEEEMKGLASCLDGKMMISMDTFNWSEAGKKLKWAVLLKLVSGRPIQKQPVEDMLRNVWKISGSATFYKVDRHVLLVNFETATDLERILSGGPWCFDGTVILMQK